MELFSTLLFPTTCVAETAVVFVFHWSVLLQDSTKETCSYASTGAEVTDGKVKQKQY